MKIAQGFNWSPKQAELTPVRPGRRRKETTLDTRVEEDTDCSENKSIAKDQDAKWKPEPEDDPPNKTGGLPEQNHCQRLALKAQSRWQWSERCRARKHAQIFPKNPEGQARGFGRQEGRWGWREIRQCWERCLAWNTTVSDTL